MSTETKTGNALRMTTGKVRFSYLNVAEPKTAPGSTEPKYSVSLIILKTDTETINKVKACIAAAQEEGKAKLVDSKSKPLPAVKIKNPLRDGDVDRPGDEAYAGCYFLNANAGAKYKPSLFGLEKDDKGELKPISTDNVKSGDFGRASINFYAYNVSGSAGIAVGLNGLQKVEDGEALGSSGSAKDDFNDGFGEDADDLL